MMRRKLLDEVSMDELMYMRNEEGLSNKEIAERIQCSYATICKVLGPQPKGVRKPYTRKEPAIAKAKVITMPTHMTAPELPVASKVNDEIETVLLYDERTYTLAGTVGKYMISDKSKMVMTEVAGTSFSMTFEEFENYAKEVLRIATNLGKFMPRMEGL